MRSCNLVKCELFSVTENTKKKIMKVKTEMTRILHEKGNRFKTFIMWRGTGFRAFDLHDEFYVQIPLGLYLTCLWMSHLQCAF